MAWTEVRWAGAHQIVSFMGGDGAALSDGDVAPRAHFAALRADGDRSGAVAFIGHALPRLEAIAWAARVLEQEAAAIPPPTADRQALDHVLRWLGDPTDASRRSADAAASAAGERSAEGVLAEAVFFSGGSIAAPAMAPIQPPPDLANRFAALAVTLAAARAPDRAAVFDRALDLGEQVAEHGLKALSPR